MLAMLGSSVDSAYDSMEVYLLDLLLSSWRRRLDERRSLLKLRGWFSAPRGTSALLRPRFRMTSKLPLEKSPLARGEGPVGEAGLRGERVALTLSRIRPVWTWRGGASPGAAAPLPLLNEFLLEEEDTVDAALSSWMNDKSTFFSLSPREVASSMRILRTEMASLP